MLIFSCRILVTIFNQDCLYIINRAIAYKRINLTSVVDHSCFSWYSGTERKKAHGTREYTLAINYKEGEQSNNKDDSRIGETRQTVSASGARRIVRKLIISTDSSASAASTVASI